MPDILGYWDRRSDDPNYIGDDLLGNAIYKNPMKKSGTSNIYLIRHAEAELNLVDVVGGRSNHSPLTKKGIRQAKALSERLKFIYRRNAKIISSPAERCISTLFYSLGDINFEVNPLFQELDQGRWTGRPRKEVYTYEVRELIAKNPWHFKAPGGESQAEVARRAVRALDMEFRKGYWDRIIYAHGGTIKYLCAELFGWEKKEAWKLPVDNCSITHLKHTPLGYKLVEFNS